MNEKYQFVLILFPTDCDIFDSSTKCHHADLVFPNLPAAINWLLNTLHKNNLP